MPWERHSSAMPNTICSSNNDIVLILYCESNGLGNHHPGGPKVAHHPNQNSDLPTTQVEKNGTPPPPKNLPPKAAKIFHTIAERQLFNIKFCTINLFMALISDGLTFDR